MCPHEPCIDSNAVSQLFFSPSKQVSKVCNGFTLLLTQVDGFEIDLLVFPPGLVPDYAMNSFGYRDPLVSPRWKQNSLVPVFFNVFKEFLHEFSFDSIDPE